jgi:phage terminase large subunit-like protein
VSCKATIGRLGRLPILRGVVVSLKKTVRELKESGGWDHLSKAEQSRRLAQEAALFAFGTPARPANLSPKEKRLWEQYTSALLEKRVLAQSDGPIVLELVRAKLLEDSEAMKAGVRIFMDRTPFPEEPDEQPEQIVEAPAVPDATETAKAYADDVLSGKIVAGKFVRLACKRFLEDFKRDDLLYDPVAAQHVVNFMQGKLGIQLLSWQIFCLVNLFAWKIPASGLRRFRYSSIFIAKKNGKSTMMAGIGLYMAMADGEPNANVYCAATTKYQSASICFKMAVALREKNPDVFSESRKWKAAITWPDGSSFEPLAANSSKLNGLNIFCGLVDEVSDHVDSSLHNVFTSSTTGRKQPMIISISTAGESRTGLCWELRARAAQILEGVLPGDSFFAYIAEMDEGDDPENDESVWLKSNPSLGVLVPIENIRDLLAQARAIPSTKHAFLRFSFNIWSNSSITSWINHADLEAKGCAYITDEDKDLTPGKRIAKAEARLAVPQYTAEEIQKMPTEKFDSLRLVGRRCYAGLDLAVVNDLSALALLFPPEKPDGIFEVLFYFWCAEECIERRTREQRVPYEAWASNTPPFIITTPGAVTDLSFIKHMVIDDLRKRFKIVELGFDRALAEDLCKSLEVAGMKVTQVAQGFGLSPALLRTERLIVEHKLCTHGHPVANWNFSNCCLTHGYKGDVRVERLKSREKIDGAVAAAVAMYTYLMQPAQDSSPDRYKMRFL